MMTESAIGLFSTRLVSPLSEEENEERSPVLSETINLDCFAGTSRSESHKRNTVGLKAVGQAENVTARKRA